MCEPRDRPDRGIKKPKIKIKPEPDPGGGIGRIKMRGEFESLSRVGRWSSG
jgi:hypothetical protein